MSVTELFTILTRIVYALLAFVTLAQWVRTRARSRLDIALVFVSLGLTIALEGAFEFFGITAPWLDQVSPLALVAHPYFLLRIAHYFRPVPRLIRRVALFGLIVSLTGLLYFRQDLPAPFVLLVVVYFAGVELYATGVFVRGAVSTAGITRQRLRLASAGSGLLAGIILLAGVGVLLPDLLGEQFDPLVQLLALLAGVSYYLGISPPRWLRQTWQLTELHTFLRSTAGHWIQQASTTYRELTAAAVRATGAIAAVIAPWDADAKTLTVDAPGKPAWVASGLEARPDLIARVWRDRKARYAGIGSGLAPDVTAWLTGNASEGMLIVPIVSLSRTWGLLLVCLRHAPLFLEDDLDLLSLLSSQSAIMLDHAELLEKLKTTNQSLEQRVAERTALLEKTVRELHESEARFRVIIEQAPSAMLVVDEAGRIDLANVKAQSIFGYGRAELIGQPVEMLVPASFQAEHTKLREEFTNDPAGRGLMGGREVPGRHKDGSEVPLEIGLTPYESPQGRFTVALVVDITERKQARQTLQNAHDLLETQVRERTAALTEANNLLQTMMNNTPDHIYFKDAQSRFIRNSRSQARMMGLKDPADAVGKSDFDFFPKAHAQRSFDEEQEVLRSGRPLINIEERVVWPDGNVTWVSTTKLPFRDANDGIVGTFGISREITERKQAEEALQNSHAQLEAANKELESFSYSVSHDLRAPLRSIDGFSQALLEDYGEQLPEEARSYLHRARGAAQRMAQLIDDILELSRVARAPINRREVDLSAMAETIVGELQREQPVRKVEFSILPSLVVEGDQNLLQIAMQNLLANAWKFTSKKERARIELGVQDGGDEKIYFVRDNGSGFDMNYAGKLFGAFQRLHSTDEFPGTGIGLATVQRVFHKHGGRVWAEGVVDQGATFYFTL